MQTRKAVAIIGGGASGLLTAIQLLSQSGASGPRVYLIEKQDTFGFGAAYATNDASHLLNVRAGNMSGFPDDPRHFIDWLQADRAGKAAAATPCCFVSRQTYGHYLRSILRDAVTGAGAAGRFYIVPDEAVSIRAMPRGGYSVRLALGKDIEANGAVLAFGNPPPHPPGVSDGGVFESPYYIGDPWSRDMSLLEPKDGTILILGTGLTMVDAVLSFVREGHRGPIVAISRRGLLPRRHALTAPSSPPPVPPRLISSLAASLRAVRYAVREHTLRGGDWREVVDSLRPMTAAYWRSLPLVEQRRFLRHLRAWWDVHRHRLAPEVANSLDALVEGGSLKIVRGRLKSFCLTGDVHAPVSATWTPYNTGGSTKMAVSRIVNCMGPGHDPRHSPFPLVRQMLAGGLIAADELGLGVAVDGMGRVIGTRGEAQPALFALGPATRGAFWEVTAIPDIRVKAAEVAKAILLAIQENGQEGRPSGYDCSEGNAAVN
jgi:uncharacterized NAD(P)/FAD-binding protein YdhS